MSRHLIERAERTNAHGSNATLSQLSGHACAGGAARYVLEHEYGLDGFDVQLSSPAATDVSLKYTAWKQITDDVDDARIK
ncbi:MAG: hypothetical protein ABI895_21525 [Deltaproteobacteria bacterium]